MKFYVLLLIFFAATMSLFAQEACYECHGEVDFVGETEDGREYSLYVDAEKFATSVHADFGCADCHMDAESHINDPGKLEPVNCGMCHEDSWDNFFKGAHGRLVEQGDVNAPTCSSCHTSHHILSASDTSSSVHPFNLSKTCGQCHSGEGVATGGNISIDRPIAHYLKGVHGQALAAGNDMAASCASCHEPHLSLPKADPQSKIFRFNISATCGQCHADEQEEYDASIHGVALQKGEFLSATCISCHEAHEIHSSSDPESPTHPLNAPDKICAPCHSSDRLNERYGFTGDVFNSYKDSYHGLAASAGSAVAANCNSCHGVHNIRSKTDSLSMTHPKNVRETCAQCHTGATDRFARSYVHANPDSKADQISGIIRVVYIYLIVIVIGGMVLHNLIIWFAYVRAKLRALKVQKTIQRFDRAWVIQHVTMFVTFTTLCITGFALKNPDAGWVKVLSFLGLNELIRGIIHRIAAVGMLAAGMYHLWFLFFVKSWKGELVALLPNVSDVRLFFQNMKYHMGLSKEHPQFDRYGYIEKAEYWALIWGTVMMAFTGFVLWFPTIATKFMPAWIVKVSETVHYYEAILAGLAILLYHMFFAIFHPEDYPINLTGFTGKIPDEEAKERFPMWYKKLKADEDSKDSDA